MENLVNPILFLYTQSEFFNAHSISPHVFRVLLYSESMESQVCPSLSIRQRVYLHLLTPDGTMPI